MAFRITLTDDELRRAQEMQANGTAVRAIAHTLGVPDYRVRKTLVPGFAERRRAEKQHEQYNNNSRIVAELDPIDRVARHDAERMLRQLPPDTRSLTARIAGDPLPGRSALDRGTP